MGNLLTLLDWSQNSINEQADKPLVMNNVFIYWLSDSLALYDALFIIQQLLDHTDIKLLNHTVYPTA